MNQTQTCAPTDLFGDVIAVQPKPKRAPVQRTDEQRKMLSEVRFAKRFSMSSLFAEIGTEPVVLTKDDEDYEGKANPELDAQLRVSNADLS